MFKGILRIIIVILIFLAVLWVGGSNWSDFKQKVGLKNPSTVYEPLVEKVPELEIADNIDTSNNTEITTEHDYIGDLSSSGDATEIVKQDIDNDNSNNGSSSNNSNQEITTQDLNINYNSNTTIGTNDTNASTNTSIHIGTKEVNMSKVTTVKLLDFLAINYTTGISVSVIHHDEETTTTTSNNNSEFSDDTLYDNTLESEDELNALIATITTVDSLPKYDDYDRNAYEKAVQKYNLDGTKVNRNDYAWKTSSYYNANDNTYTCPYTGTIINDLDDGKEDNDYGNLDYDHIVPLKSTYVRGAKDWTDKQKNEYAYNQWVGVDVLNSANRSKSDKGPSEYLPDINVDDYCFTWLVICSKYNLVMTTDEVNICKENIELSLTNGDSVEFMGGSYNEESNK